MPYTEDVKYPNLRIYREPKKDERYYWGVDTSMGGIDGDPSTIIIRDKELNLMATYRDFIPADDLCKVIDYLYQLGYHGVIGIERNNTGLATITKAKEYIWYMDIYATRTLDKKTNKKTKSV